MADITGNTAPIGGGKSLWATGLCCHELEHSDRFIITDVPLIFDNPPEGYWTVAEFCHKFVKSAVPVNHRICVVSAEQASEFWRYLPAEAFGHISDETFKEYGITLETFKWSHGESRLLKLPNKPHPLFKEVPDFRFRTEIAKNRIGCHYIIDEAHKKFPPMHYQRVGAQAEWYMSELRKLDDDLDWITQHPEKVDKNFRRNCTQWMNFQNMSRASLFMGVSFKGRFRWHWYNQSEIPSRQDKPTKSGWYQLDPKRRVHQLYKTMDGTGVSGGMLKESSMHKGRHWTIWLLALVGILVAAWFLPQIIEKVVTQGIGGLAGGFQRGIQKGTEKMMAPAPAAPPAPAPATPPPVAPASIPQVHNLPPVHPAFASGAMPRGIPQALDDGGLFCTGTWEGFNGDTVVFLSSGEVLYKSRGEVQDVGSRFVRVLGGMILPRSPLH